MEGIDKEHAVLLARGFVTVSWEPFLLVGRRGGATAFWWGMQAASQCGSAGAYVCARTGGTVTDMGNPESMTRWS